MSAIATSAVTTITSDLVGTVSNKLVARRDRLAIVLSSQGATAGDITASILGFAEILSVFCYRFIKGGPAEAFVGVTTDGTNIFTFTAIDGTTATANVSGTLYIEVTGRSL